MSIAHLLSINATVNGGKAGQNPFQFRRVLSPFRVFLPEPAEPAPPNQPVIRSGPLPAGEPAHTRAPRSLGDWLKLAFLLSLLFLCTGAFGVNYVCQQRQAHAWAQVVQQQERRAERYWRELLWYRARLAQNTQLPLAADTPRRGNQAKDEF